MPASVAIFETMRTEATYRITFDTIDIPGIGPVEPATMDLDLLGRRIADVLHAFSPVELRISADGNHGALVVYVSVPADVMPEALDRKAEALRAKWKGEGPRRTRTDPETGCSVSWTVEIDESDLDAVFALLAHTPVAP